jgi:Ala-tRNA(Pro) deacylase
MGQEVRERILALLKEKKIHYELFHHEHVHTSIDAAKVRGTKLEQAAKALILKEKQTGKFLLFIVGGDRKLNLKNIKKLFGIKNISLAPPEEVYEKTTCTIGSVPPFGNVLSLPSYMDSHLAATQEEIVFCAGTHHDSIRMKTTDFIAVVQPTLGPYGFSS